MKASIKLRQDRSPLVTAKIPFSAAGIPLLSKISTGDAADLGFDLTTASECGPSFRFSYRPNDAGIPFAVGVRIGSGSMGSPISSVMTMTAVLGLGRAPTFSIVFKPRLGDFRIKKAIGSESGAPPVTLQPEINGLDGCAEENGIPAEIRPDSAGEGILRAFSGAEMTASSFLPLRSCTAVRFRWGVRIPAEVHTAIGEHPAASVSFRRLPHLVMRKLSIERVAADPRPNEMDRTAPEIAVQRKATADIRDDVEERKEGANPPPAPDGRRDRRRSWSSSDNSAKAKLEDDVSEELKKALMGVDPRTRK
ncbi:uncharacterized protein [Typha latifolia]|uniref:uncharacterized protein n=1 Tax=Typha latifolia TaxID=4733 RepID=UPI003C2CFCDD